MPDAYATAAQFRERNQTAPADDTLVGEVLDAASRYIDRRLGWCEGAFAPIASTAVTFWPGQASRVLRLRDSEGAAWPLRDWTEIEMDYSGSGTADHTLTPPAVWIIAEPASNTDRPHRSLRMWGSHVDAIESMWPSDPGVVTVTATWGWATTPAAIRELSCYVARSMLDTELGGAASMVQLMETGVTLSDDGGRLWRRVEMEYSAGRMARLGVVGSAVGRRR